MFGVTVVGDTHAFTWSRLGKMFNTFSSMDTSYHLEGQVR